MIKNIENSEQYYYPADMSKNRLPGVSAIMRVKNEEEFIIPSILSIKDFFDEIIVVFNQSTDRSEELVRKLNLPNIKIFQYPFDVVSAGPDTKGLCVNSVHHIVYYTNYSISLSSYEWIYRWDGDNIALPSFYDLKNIINCDQYNSVEDRAWDLVDGTYQYMLGSQEMVSFEKRLIRIRDNVRYILSPNQFCEQAYVPGLSFRVDEPTFVHMKWCKNNPGHQWKNNWRNEPHFRAIEDRHKSLIGYTGLIPDILVKYNKLGRDPDRLIGEYKL